jgi:hypothetical protein
MAVVTVATVTVKPDQFEEFVENARKGKAINEKHGAKNVRLLAGLVAGEATGSFAYILEADDFAAFGAVLDKILADPEMRPIMSTGSTSPTASYQTTLWVDVPL